MDSDSNSPFEPATFVEFGALLRFLRGRAQVTQRELSIAVGYSFGQISRLEQGQRLPDPDVVAAVFVPALDLANEPAWAQRLVALAHAAHDQRAADSRAAAALADATPAPVGANDRTASVDALGAPLLATKLYRPHPRWQRVARPRLLARLDAALHAPLTLVSASAGSGKTTLLADWLASLARIENAEWRIEKAVRPILHSQFSILNLPPQAAWLTLDDDDNDPTSFLRYLIAALQSVAPTLGGPALALVQSSQPPPADVVLRVLLNDLGALPHPTLLVFDDYHLITTPAIHMALAELVAHAPPALHLIIATRADPPLPLHQLRARGQLVEVRAADLRFNPDEAATFLADVMGLPLATADVAALEARTEGWIAGLQLAALAMRDRADRAGFISAFTGSNRFVVDYLAGDVFARQPPHLQAFLLQTSLLDRLCGPLCDAVLGLAPDAAAPSDSYSQLVLEQIERANLFLVPLDDERRWYRYHHLFGAMLRARLTSGVTAVNVVLLHLRASAWYEQAGEINAAVQHALAARDWPQVATLIERHSATLTARGEALVVQRWVRQLPDALLRSRPALAVRVGWVYLFTGQFDAAERMLADVPSPEMAQLNAPLAGSALVLRSTLARGRGDDAATLALAQQALDVLPADAPAERAAAMINIGITLLRQGKAAQAVPLLEETARLGLAGGDLYLALAAIDELAGIRIRRGALAAALHSCQQALAAVERQSERPIPPLGLPLTRMGEVLYEWNELARAADVFERGIALLRGATELSALLRAYLGLARTQAAQGRRDAMAATVAQCEDWFAQLQLSDHSAVANHIASFWARLAAPAARAAPPAAPAEGGELGRVRRVTRARQHLHAFRHDNTPDAAAFLATMQQLIAALLAEAEERGWVADQIELHLLLALAYQAVEQTQLALDALAPALALAEPAGYVRAFVDEGEPLAALLGEERARGIGRAYVARLIAAFPDFQSLVAEPSPDDAAATHSSQPAANHLVEPLSARELEVLRLLDAGHSNQEVARALVIAVGTVKRHISSILGKLGARSRLEAVARARTLRLLVP